MEQLIVNPNEGPNSLFYGCQFFLVGFQSENQERNKLSQVLRSGMGTIFWEFQENITHVIVHDNCDDTLRGSISKAKSELFGDFVTIVSAWWVVDSWKKNEPQSPREYPPLLERSRRSSSRSTQMTKKIKKESQTQNLLRGHIFVLLRISNPQPSNVDYNSKDLEILVRSHGGQIVSLRLLETLKAEHAAQGKLKGNQERRKCHVVCFGGALQQQQLQFSLHPLLAQIRRQDLCELVLVTPNWLQTCVKELILVDPADLPLLFKPQAWSWRKLVVVPQPPSSTTTGKENNTTKGTSAAAKPTTVRISVTGFQGPKRTAIVQAIQAMGAIYDDSMHQNRTTHLISCSRNKSNPKFQKAQEWGIVVVSEDWMYHVLQHGPGNKEENKDNSASRFAITSKS